MRSLINLIKGFLNENYRFYFFVLSITIFYGIVFSIVDFYNNPISGFLDFLIIAFQWATISFATFGLLYLISINRIVFGIVFPSLTATSAILAYFRGTANVSFNVMILDSALDNDIRTSLDLVSLSLCLFLIVCILFSVAIVIYRIRLIKRTFAIVHLTIAIIILLTANFFFKIRRPVSERIPFTLFYTIKKYSLEQEAVREIRKELNKGSFSNEDSLIVICILGESLRSDHLSINGYKRNTTPLLEKAKVISFPKIYSEYTHTNRSIPHLLTRADSLHPDRAFSESSFIGLYKAAGFHTTWLANQEPADTYVYFIKEADELYYANLGQSVYNYGKWLDGDLLPYLKQMLQKEFSKQLIVMHTIGSHWWYNSHFPDSFTRFSPIVKSKVISSCSQQEMINSYDNTIFYSDYFFSQVIKTIENRTSIIIYLSDHGEALGEDNQWLHAHNHYSLHKAACFIWMSPSYKEKYKDKYYAALQNANKNWRTDFLFHTMLGAGEVLSPYRVDDFNLLVNKR